jgi:hypothetical protein
MGAAPRHDGVDGRERLGGGPWQDGADGRDRLKPGPRLDGLDGRERLSPGPRLDGLDGRERLSPGPRLDGLDGRERLGGGPRLDGVDGRERLGAAPRLGGRAGAGRLSHGVQEPAGPVIRQRESAVPEERGEDSGQPVASIAPDDLEAFARDLRALRAKAGLDYPEMAELSHYEMKTLASAAGGLRLPTLPVTVAYVRACDGDVAEWEERWQKLASRISADAGSKRRADEEQQQQASAEAAPLPPAAEPPALGPPPARAAEPEGTGPGEVYVITSAKPRPPAW